MPGRKAELPEIKAKRGNPGKRKIDTDHVKPVDNAPPFIAQHLDDDAKAAIELIRASMPPGTYHKIDGFALAAFAMAWARHKQAVTALRDQPAVEIGSQGQPVISPWIRIEADQARLMLTYADKLGLTPTARAALKAPAPADAPKSKFAGLLGAKPIN